MKTRTVTYNYVEVKDFEDFVLQIVFEKLISQEAEEILGEFAEKIFFKYNQLDLISSMLKHTPSKIINEVMFQEGKCYDNSRWNIIEEEWLQFLKDHEIVDTWYENLKK